MNTKFYNSTLVYQLTPLVTNPISFSMTMGRKTWLMTPDPYHIPGYCGYCPQLKYHIGRTFGGHTHNLLTSRDVACSGRSVLASTEPAQYHEEHTQSPFYDRPIQPGEELSSTRPELKLTSSMVPGYTGVIPKGQHYFGCRYALASRHAIDDFQRDQTHLHQQAVDMRRTADLQRDPTLRASMTSSHHTTPLMSMSQYPEPYVTDFARQHTESAFLLPPGHPDKRFMSGYTGFVPKARKYLGEGYPIISQQALSEHFGEQDRLDRLKSAPVEVSRPIGTTVRPDTTVSKAGSLLYPKTSGLVPRYTGHIPSHRFSFGVPFGQSTQNALATLPRGSS